jgi:hypothetical protein
MKPEAKKKPTGPNAKAVTYADTAALTLTGYALVSSTPFPHPDE